jgi:hypothetical protein
MNQLEWQPPLSALALVDAWRHGSYEALRSVTEDTPPLELHLGLVQLCSMLLLSFAVGNGMTADEAADKIRQGLLAAAIQ